MKGKPIEPLPFMGLCFYKTAVIAYLLQVNYTSLLSSAWALQVNCKVTTLVFTAENEH